MGAGPDGGRQLSPGSKMKCCGSQPVTPIRLVHHAPGAPGLRLLGLGPDLRPSRALLKLHLFDRHAFWARGHGFAQLRRLLAVVTP